MRRLPPLILVLYFSAVCPLNSDTVAAPSFSEPSIAPDRPEIAFVSGGDIWTASLAGGEAHLLISHPATESRPLYSPDGKRLAFMSTRSGNPDIYVLDFANGQTHRLTYDDAAEHLDAWSRDGKFLFFSTASHDVAGNNDLYRVSADGGTPMPVSDDRYLSEYWAAPSPDGSAIAFTAKGIVANQWWRHGHAHIDESEAADSRQRNGERMSGGAARTRGLCGPQTENVCILYQIETEPRTFTLRTQTRLPRFAS